MDAKTTDVGYETPESDLRAFRRCLGQFATGITVVTAETPAGRVGNTANSFSSISLDPPLIAWALGKTSRSYNAFREAKHFSVNVLGSDQIAISQAFSSGDEDKFKSISWLPGHNGAPRVMGAIAVLECETEALYECGDHILLIGRVARYARSNGKPLLYVQGYYGIAEPHPDLKPRETRPSLEDSSQESYSLATLIFRVHHELSARFDKYRQAQGVTVSHARVLVSLRNKQHKTAAQIIDEMYLPRPDAMDAIGDLLNRGLITKKGTVEEFALTDAGEKLQLTLHERLREFDSTQTEEISPEELHSARKVLFALLNHS
ncbi:flavin reductase [Paraburkholderia fynbosensis]|uniref:FMN reductase (NADH) NtaB n=1 Tax=Paraburkholderia fynbosensis TaxID=1200993 RepID=A0A6J5H0R4_9BURK|nr:flavin reductase [Paraburkholderia fynbosensis]CAB3806978.1 FMN reductase (NADH) NtaB [Paraburkholderia fynbosensis]